MFPIYMYNKYAQIFHPLLQTCSLSNTDICERLFFRKTIAIVLVTISVPSHNLSN